MTLVETRVQFLYQFRRALLNLGSQYALLWDSTRENEGNPSYWTIAKSDRLWGLMAGAFANIYNGVVKDS